MTQGNKRIMANEKNWTADRVKAIVKKAIEGRSDAVCIRDVRVTDSGYFAVELAGSIYTDELNEISRGVCDRLINVSATDYDEIQLFFKPGNHDPKEFDDNDDYDDYDYQEQDEDTTPRIPDNMRHTDRFPDAEDIVIPGTEQRVSNTEMCEQILKWMQDTGHMPIVYVRLDDGVHVEVSDVYDRRIKAVIQEGKAIGADARRYTFDKDCKPWPIGGDICVRATCDETGRSDMYGLSFFV